MMDKESGSPVRSKKGKKGSGRFLKSKQASTVDISPLITDSYSHEINPNADATPWLPNGDATSEVKPQELQKQDELLMPPPPCAAVAGCSTSEVVGCQETKVNELLVDGFAILSYQTEEDITVSDLI